MTNARRAALKRAPADNLLRLWRARYHRGNPSPGLLSALTGLRRDQTRVIAQWRSGPTSLDPPPMDGHRPTCECREIQFSVHTLMDCPKYAESRRGFVAGLATPVLFVDIVLEENQVFPLLAFLKRAKLFSGSASFGPGLLMAPSCEWSFPLHRL